jgi:putative nucleotidyltransferase with HDIG domain
MTPTTSHNPNAAVDQQDLRKKIKRAVKDLPPMPAVVNKIQQLLFDPNSTAQQIADFIETDQAIAAKVLKMANSTYYGMSGKVSSVHHAAVILGFKALGELCTIAAFSDFMGNKLPGYGYHSDELWKHSLAVAGAAKLIAEKLDPQIVHEALTTGLIHDIGKLILDPYVLEQRETFDAFIEGGDQTFLEAEKQILGFDHADIAADICKHWKFSESLTQAIQYHHCPSRSHGNQMAFILHLADYIAVLSGSGYDIDEVLDIREEGTEEFLDIHQKDIISISSSIIEYIFKIETDLSF